MRFFKKKFFTTVFVGVLTVGMVAIYVPMFFTPKAEPSTPTPVNQATTSVASNPTSTSQSQSAVVTPTQTKSAPEPVPTPPPPVTGGKSLEDLKKILNQ